MTARLILINGAPGSGKSTLARRYVDAHPLTLALDIDVVRSMLGSWADRPGEAGVLARRLAVEMARTQLASGHEVLVPQYLGRIEFVRELERLSQQVGVRFVEVALVTTVQETIERFTRRCAAPACPTHVDALTLLERSGPLDALLPEMHAQFLDVVARRPHTILIPALEGQIDRTYRDLLAALAELD